MQPCNLMQKSLPMQSAVVQFHPESLGLFSPFMMAYSRGLSWGPSPKHFCCRLHVDAAFAGGYAVLPQMRHHLDGVEACDSFSTNAHKVGRLLTPKGCSRSGTPLKQAGI